MRTASRDRLRELGKFMNIHEVSETVVCWASTVPMKRAAWCEYTSDVQYTDMKKNIAV